MQGVSVVLGSFILKILVFEEELWGRDCSVGVLRRTTVGSEFDCRKI
jgi:hypothetical protein